MPLPSSSPRTLVHHRDLDCRGYEREDGLWDIEGHLVDTKSYSFDNLERGPVQAGEPIHEMWLRITIDDELLIHAAQAVTDFSPYHMCPDITVNFERLAGLRIGPGWWRDVQKRIGGTQGCTHLVELIRPLATTAFQTLVKARKHQNPDPNRRPHWLNTCHAHASDREVVRLRWPAFYTGTLPLEAESNAESGAD